MKKLIKYQVYSFCPSMIAFMIGYMLLFGFGVVGAVG